ncbi:MAG TPA: hypothetical protein VFO18_04440 [Methylomirabilota bacterium]|nr:hypothetical protein [Methylomirabilota bacterium]
MALIRLGTTERQQIIVGTLGDILGKAAGLEPPVVAVIGEVVRLRDRLRWFEASSSASPTLFPAEAR